VVLTAVGLRIVADLGIRRNDVEAVDDRPAEMRALADGGVVHDDGVLDHRALVDPHRPPEDRVANGRALDQRRLTDLRVVDVAPDEASRGTGMVRAADRPEAVVEVEARRLAEEIHVSFPVRGDRTHVTPVGVLLVWLHARDLVLLEVVREHPAGRNHLRDDRAAEVVIGGAPGVGDERVEEGLAREDVVAHRHERPLRIVR